MNHSVRIGIQILACALCLGSADRAHAAGERAVLDAACRLPTEAPAIPDGATASESELLAAQAAVRRFDASIAEYTKCLAEVVKQAAVKEPASAEAMELARIERNNAAVALAEGRVAQFNAEFRKFRDRDLTPPSILSLGSESDRLRCYPEDSRWGTIVFDLEISASGELTRVVYPPDTAPQTRAAIDCVVGGYRFSPATRKGTAVAGVLGAQRIDFGDEPVAIEEGLELPVVKAEGGKIAEAAAKCRKPGQREGGKVGLFVTVRRTGGVEAVRRGASSGNAEVDDLAVCIARRLVFKPARQDGKAITLFDVPITLDVPPLD